MNHHPEFDNNFSPDLMLFAVNIESFQLQMMVFACALPNFESLNSDVVSQSFLSESLHIQQNLSILLSCNCVHGSDHECFQCFEKSI